MKNMLRILPVLILFGAASCDKDYACTCESNAARNPTMGANIPQSYTYRVNATKRSTAEDKCNAYTSTLPEWYDCEIQ